MRPNILVITSDQQRTDSIGCYGAPWMQTSGLDRLAAGGAILGRAYCANPVCTPSRASLFSGRHVSRHGAWNVGTHVPEDLPLLSHLLAAAAYDTHYIGKAHFQPYFCEPDVSVESCSNWAERYPAFKGPYYGFGSVELALGHTVFGVAGDYGAWVRSQCTQAEFQSWQSARSLSPQNFGGEAYDWDLPHGLHNSVWTADRAIEYLDRKRTDQPFFLAVGFQDPHGPHCLPRDYPRRLKAEDVPLPDFTPGELDDKPAHFGWANRGELEGSPARGDYYVAGQGPGSDFRQVSARDARLGRSYYYGMVELMDAQIGRILDRLEESGLAENTLVVFASDHGELLGDHGLWMKGPFHYEQLIRVPLLMRWPQGFAAGERHEALLSLCDIAPTVLTAAGVPVPAEMDGVDALPLLRGDVEKVRDNVLVEFVDDPRCLRLKTVVTRDAKLTRYNGQEAGELFDLAADPREKANLWDKVEHAGTKARLLGKLLDDLEPHERRQTRYCYA